MGGILRLPDGTRFMPAHDERAELAPRDVVARAIDFEMKRHGIDCVYLDISHQSEAFLHEHFPTILVRCRGFGIDIAKQPIPVVPAAHYICGGVVTDLADRTDCAGLYAVGEYSYTGLHGANRLASNSLLECLVVGRVAAQAIEEAGVSDGFRPPLPELDKSHVSDADEEVVVAHYRDEVQRLMWNYVGIVRTDKRFVRARQRLALLRNEIKEYYGHFKVTPRLLELRNLVDIATLIVESACSRRESRGLHVSLDCPDTLPEALPTVLMPPDLRRRVQ